MINKQANKRFDLGMKRGTSCHFNMNSSSNFVTALHSTSAPKVIREIEIEIGKDTEIEVEIERSRKRERGERESKKEKEQFG